MPVCHYSIPQHWIQKYNLPANPCSASGLNRITIGKDQGGLFPVLRDHYNGVVVSRSKITSRCILSGRAASTSDKTMMANKTAVDHDPVPGLFTLSSPAVKPTSDSSNSQKKEYTIYVSPTLETATKIDVTSPVLEGQTPHSTNEEPLAGNNVGKAASTEARGQQTSFKMGSETKDLLLKELSTDSINIHPIKRCAKCSNCRDCKKNHLPDPARQKEQADIVRRSLTFRNGRYTAAYPYNGLFVATRD